MTEWENSLYFKRFFIRNINEVLNSDIPKNVKSINLENIEVSIIIFCA